MAINIALHIKDLLYDNGSVTIPGLGMIIADYHSAELNHAEAKIYPPRYRYSIEPKLKESDGVLEEVLIDKYQLSKEQTAELLARYTEQIKTHLAHGKQIVLKGIGQLVLKNGKLEIIENESTVDPHSEFLPVLNLNPASKTSNAQVKTGKLNKTNKGKESLVAKNTIQKNKTPQPSVAPVKEKKSEDSKSKKDKPRVSAAKTQGSKSEHPKKKKSGFGRVLLISLLFGFVLALAAGWYFLYPGETLIPDTDPEVAEENVVDTADDKASGAVSGQQEEEALVQDNEVSVTKDCAVIVGVFGDQNNINRLKKLITVKEFEVFEKPLKGKSVQLGIYCDCKNYSEQLKYAKESIDKNAFLKNLNK